MSHEVESMAYTNEVPWHGLGTYVEDAPSVEQLLEAARLTWSVSKRQMLVPSGNEFITVPGKYALMRDTDNRVLDVVGSIYTPTQNHEAFEFFREFVDAGAATMETAGSLKNGQYVWALCRLNQDFTLPGNDLVKGYILLASPHRQGKSLLVRPTTIRVVCHNTMTMALAGKVANEYRHAHRGEFNAQCILDAKEALGIAREQLAQWEQHARALKGLKVIHDDVVRILATVFQPEADANAIVKEFDNYAGPRMKRLVDIHENAPGADPETGWGVLNTVTYYSDHIASRNADNRMASAWMGNMAKFKTQTQELLLERVA